MPPSRLLIIAPDTGLRQSLQFALEAEDYDVTWGADIETVDRGLHYDCTIIDHHAVADLAAARAFVDAFSPVILLANADHRVSPWVFRTILKPHLGATVTAAVREAIATPAAPTK